MTAPAAPAATGPAYGTGLVTGGLRATAVEDRPGNIARYGTYALVLLTVANVLGFYDRYVVAAMVTTLQDSSLDLSNTQAGLLASGFIGTYMFTAPIFGTLADRTSRTRILGWGVAVWSLGSRYHGRRAGLAARHPRTGRCPGVVPRLLRNARYLAIVVGYSEYGAAIGALGADLPRAGEGPDTSEAALSFGAIVLVSGLIGTVAGGYVGDWLDARIGNGYLWLSGVAVLASVPLLLLAIDSRTPSAYLTAVFFAQLLLFMTTSPITAAIVGQAPPELRATAVAVSIFALHLLEAPAPFVIGAVSDATSLEAAFQILPFVLGIAGVVWVATAARRSNPRVAPATPR